jgi:hypothetical protein
MTPQTSDRSSIKADVARMHTLNRQAYTTRPIRTFKETIDMPTKQHLEAYLDAMHRRNVAGTIAHMADDVVIRSPIVPNPFEGKQQVVELLKVCLTMSTPSI